MFQDLPKMSDPAKVSLTPIQLEQLQLWRAEFGQSVWQSTVHDLSTKDKPGTLPMYSYTPGPVQPKPVEFASAINTESVADSESEDHDNRSTRMMEKGNLVCLKSAEISLFLLEEDVHDEQND